MANRKISIRYQNKMIMISLSIFQEFVYKNHRVFIYKINKILQIKNIKNLNHQNYSNQKISLIRILSLDNFIQNEPTPKNKYQNSHFANSNNNNNLVVQKINLIILNQLIISKSARSNILITIKTNQKIKQKNVVNVLIAIVLNFIVNVLQISNIVHHNVHVNNV